RAPASTVRSSWSTATRVSKRRVREEVVIAAKKICLRRCRSGVLPFDYPIERRNTVRFMMIVKADKRTEAGVLPTRNDLETMGKYNEQLIKAGILVDAAGLQPSSKGAR